MADRNHELGRGAPGQPGPEPDLGALTAIVRGRRVALLTGAGCSTESGIPDYRGPQTRSRPRNPILHQDFVRDPAVRQRYWARATRGWPRFVSAVPNPTHHAIAELERAGLMQGLITQNVDGLHQAAGSEAVIELHGSLHQVVCLQCGAVQSRSAVHEQLLARNPSLRTVDTELAPDGDAELGSEEVEGFEVVACGQCSGVLKPHVVFFGGSVPRPVVEAAYAVVERSEVLLVVGSSLAVFSGYRFVRRAAERGLPIGIVNLGESRGDPHAAVIVQGRSGRVLPRLVETLGG